MQTTQISTVSPAYPGHVLQAGSTGSEVARVQSYLNKLFPAAQPLTVDGRFGSGTTAAVRRYQTEKGLQADGRVGRNTWDALIGDYNAAFDGSADTYPGIPLYPGDRSSDIRHMQAALNQIAAVYTGINRQTVDGRYGGNMSAAVRRFQRQFALASDAILGADSWAKIVQVRNGLQAGSPLPVSPPYPGMVLQQGLSGDSVRFVQSYLARVTGRGLTVDGIYGRSTTTVAAEFQHTHGLAMDGKVGRKTWDMLIPAFNRSL